MNKELEILKLADYTELFEVGRSSVRLIINSKIKDHACLFGFLELAENFTDAKELFGQLEERARELGYKELIGPMNYCTWLSYRLALDRYDLRLYPDCNNPAYYVDYLKRLGFKEFLTYRSARVKIRNPLYEIGKKSFEKKQREGIDFGHYEGEEAMAHLSEIYEISCAAFQRAWLYSELPFEYFERIYLEWVKQVEIQLFVAYEGERAIGFVMGYKNPLADNFIAKSSAVRPEFQNQQIFAALLYYGSNYVEKMGFSDMIYHFQCEQKPDFKRFEEKYESDEKRYALFRKELN